MTMEAGLYRAQAMSIEFGITNNGTDQAAVTFELLESHETITAYLYFSERAAARSIDTLRMMGWKGSDAGEITVGEIQNEVDLVIEESEYEGKVSLKVKWINEVGGGPALKNKMDDAHKASFSDRMRGLAIATAPKEGNGKTAPKPVARAAAKPAPRKAAPVDDDVPSWVTDTDD
jgi:hypothetical protein